jgi:hypothetical protein
MTFLEARQQQLAILCAAVQAREEDALLYDGRLKPRPLVPWCPITIGNDPCDDWSEDDEDYDW